MIFCCKIELLLEEFCFKSYEFCLNYEFSCLTLMIRCQISPVLHHKHATLSFSENDKNYLGSQFKVQERNHNVLKFRNRSELV